jgi:hypothetical protein
MIFCINSLKQPAILQRLRTSETKVRVPTFPEEPKVLPVLPEVRFGWDAGTMRPPFSTSLHLKDSGFSHEMNNSILNMVEFLKSVNNFWRQNC